MWEGFGGAALSGAASLIGGAMANAQSVQSAREQMQFQERMRDTQYQAAVKDLQKAGLNPMLAYSNGGAAVPSGAMAQIKDALGPAVNSAVDAYTKQQAVETAKTAQEQAQAEIAKTKADTINSLETANAIRANVDQTKASTEESKGRTNLQPYQKGVMSEEMWNLKARTAGQELSNEWFVPRFKYEQALATSSARRANASAQLDELDSARARAYQDFFRSDVGATAPYLDFGGKAISGAGQAVDVLRKGKGFFNKK
jgi:hypothetical protein